MVVVAFLGLASTSEGAARTSARMTVRNLHVVVPLFAIVLIGNDNPMDVPVENIATDTRALMKLR